MTQEELLNYVLEREKNKRIVYFNDHVEEVEKIIDENNLREFRNDLNKLFYKDVNCQRINILKSLYIKGLERRKEEATTFIKLLHKYNEKIKEEIEGLRLYESNGICKSLRMEGAWESIITEYYFQRFGGSDKIKTRYHEGSFKDVKACYKVRSSDFITERDSEMCLKIIKNMEETIKKDLGLEYGEIEDVTYLINQTTEAEEIFQKYADKLLKKYEDDERKTKIIEKIRTR